MQRNDHWLSDKLLQFGLYLCSGSMTDWRKTTLPVNNKSGEKRVFDREAWPLFMHGASSVKNLSESRSCLRRVL